MKQLYHLTLRHTVLFFKDKGRFLTALITPIVLIVLYMTFLGTVYHDFLHFPAPSLRGHKYITKLKSTKTLVCLSI